MKPIFNTVGVGYKDLPENDYIFLEDAVHEEARELLYEIFEAPGPVGVWDFELYFSLSHCQGDGACFKTLNFSERQQELVWEKISNKPEPDGLGILVEHAGGHYYHENSMNIVVEDDNGCLEEETEKLREIIQDMCIKLAEYGYRCIEREDYEDLKRIAIEKWLKKNDIEADAKDMEISDEPLGDMQPIADIEYHGKLYARIPELEDHKSELLIDGKAIGTKIFYTIK